MQKQLSTIVVPSSKEGDREGERHRGRRGLREMVDSNCLLLQATPWGKRRDS
jgi:hypothetical protein